MFFNVFAWIDDRTLEPMYRGLLLDALVDALEDDGVSVGQTTNLSIGRHAGEAVVGGDHPGSDQSAAAGEPSSGSARQSFSPIVRST